MRIDSRADSIEDGRARLLAFMRGLPVGDRERFGAELVFEEWMTNLRMHALQADPLRPVDVDVRLADGTISLCFSHEGQAFDPTTAPEPAVATDLADAQIGGRGLLLMRHFARSMHYQHDGRRATLQVTING